MQSSRPRPLYLGFSSQKGGVGKSTLAEILSSMLYYEEGISLFVVDCDLTQDSFFKLREREKGTIGEDPALTAYMQTYFHQLQRRSYRIIKARPQEALARAEALAMQYPEEGYQLVVFDFPGHAGTRELLELSLEMDYILSPLEPDIQSLVACLSYAKSIQDLGVSMQTARIKDIWLLWNKGIVGCAIRWSRITRSISRRRGLRLFPSRFIGRIASRTSCRCTGHVASFARLTSRRTKPSEQGRTSMN